MKGSGTPGNGKKETDGKKLKRRDYLHSVDFNSLTCIKGK
jgi:hypothetical protein